jgi:hypothetical protein
MSYQQCAGITSKEQRYKRHVKGTLCFQHYKSNVVHSSPALKFTPIVFSQRWYSNGCCRYKNKFGEFVCNEHEHENSNYCEEHKKVFCKFEIVLMNLLYLNEIYKINRVSIHSFYKLLKNICLFILKHKNIIVSFNLNNLISKLIKAIDDNIMCLSFRTESIIYSNYKSKPYSFYLDEFRVLRKKIILLTEITQIQSARDILVSNNIKIHKLTEIYLKKSDRLQAVISKGLDKHILKFIV